MQQPLHSGARTVAAPRFYITGRQPLRPGAILLAIVASVAAMSLLVYALGHGRHGYFLSGSDSGNECSAASGAARSGEDKDDPNQVDTIVLADPAEAPVPARKGDHVSPVHPFVVVRLPRFGDQVGLIPNSPAGHLLYDWLAAFNQGNEADLAKVLPNVAAESAAAVQIELRKETGGFNLLSAKEVQPGLLVFRLRDQTPSATEVLGTLQVRPNSSPAAIATFSLRAVISPGGEVSTGTASIPAASER